MAIDNASWHYSAANFPPKRPHENGGNHTGYFLTWIFMNHLEGDEHQKDRSSARFCDDVRKRKRTGRDFLFAIGDEKFTEDDLSQEGLAFTEHYYDDDFNDDYFATFGTDEQHMYEVDWTWANYDRLAKVMDRRFAAWRANQKVNRKLKASPARKAPAKKKAPSPVKKKAPPKAKKQKTKPPRRKTRR